MISKEITKNIDRDELESRVQKALEVAAEYSQFDGSHHKSWAIDQMVRVLTGNDYKSWVSNYEFAEKTQEEYVWETGVAP